MFNPITIDINKDRNVVALKGGRFLDGNHTDWYDYFCKCQVCEKNTKYMINLEKGEIINRSWKCYNCKIEGGIIQKGAIITISMDIKPYQKVHKDAKKLYLWQKLKYRL